MVYLGIGAVSALVLMKVTNAKEEEVFMDDKDTDLYLGVQFVALTLVWPALLSAWFIKVIGKVLAKVL